MLISTAYAQGAGAGGGFSGAAAVLTTAGFALSLLGADTGLLWSAASFCLKED